MRRGPLVALLLALLLAIVAATVIAVIVLGRGQAAVPDLGNAAAPVGGGAGKISVSPVCSVLPAETPETTLEYTIGNAGDAGKTYAASAAELDSDGSPIAAATGDAGPWVSFDQSRTTVTLVDDGTVTVVPSANDGKVAGTISDGGQPFVVAGNPVRPASTGALTGTVTEPPVACWCQVHITIADGNGDVSSVDARVLVAPAAVVIHL